MTNAPTLTEKAATLFNVTAEKVPQILWNLGFRRVCSRCHGSGKHSYNNYHGDKCYGCNGQGQKASSLTKDVYQAAQVKVENGELEVIRAQNRARNQANREALAMIGPAKAEAAEAHNLISEQYDAAYRAWSISPELMAAQTLNSRMYWGDQETTNMSVSDAERAMRAGEISAVKALEIINERIADLKLLRSEWVALSK